MKQSRIVSSFPQEIREIENTWIKLKDGCRLAARIWLPANAEVNPVPAILEYLPYRKRDGTAVRDELTYPYYAGHGYAGVRVDMRGNGESDGLMLDEYLAQEQDDALEVIDWIASQPWCDGKVGMMGISWGGFNGLQVAARRPQALKAIITLCSTDDRYADDIHYKGGAMLMENLGWASTMLSFSSRPPDPELVGDRWRSMWMNRLENSPLLIANWLEHPHRDSFWKHGSVCERFSDIQAAVYAIGGWGDAYSNTIPRLLKGLSSPVRGLTGPWIHKYPHIAKPEPAIGFLQDSVKWWDHWLKDTHNETADKPSYQVFMMDSVRPESFYESRAGRWIAESSWPSANVQYRKLALNHEGLSQTPRQGHTLIVSSPQNTGVGCGEYCAMWQGPESPTDQRGDDSGSLLFDSEPLQNAEEIFGAPLVTLDVAIDATQTNLAVRLCDVWPDGASTRITYGVLNLCHHISHEHPEALVPGKSYRVKIQLDDIAYRVRAGNRIRVAVSTAYWPLIWPSAEHVTASIQSGSSTLDLPLRSPVDDRPVEFEPPCTSSPLQLENIRPSSNTRKVEYDLASGKTHVRIEDDFGEHRDLTHGLVSGQVAREDYTIHPSDPNSCEARTHWTQSLARDDWSVRTESITYLRCDRNFFFIEAEMEAYEGDEKVFKKHWNRQIERNLV